ncbi:MAG TPA: hypothetical protein VG733_17725 [Chthoniobacteraceae bacterium]|nr:hypothetical protein [Chthoniobacteraceae bacterium]
MPEIHLDGAEITVLKAIGLGGTSVSGDTLIERIPGLEEAEIMDTLRGLITLGYLMSDKRSLYDLKDVAIANFHVNSGYARELKEALDPRLRQKPRKSRRVRRE